jgi:hypothetical protein
MQGRLWTVVAIACVLALAVPVVNGGYTEATGTDATDSTTIDYSADYQLATDGNSYVVERANTSSATLTQGEDYTVDAEAGTIDWLNTSATTDGEAVDIAYTALQPDSDTRQGKQILGTAGVWLGFALLIGAMGYIVVLIGGGDF